MGRCGPGGKGLRWGNGAPVFPTRFTQRPGCLHPCGLGWHRGHGHEHLPAIYACDGHIFRNQPGQSAADGIVVFGVQFSFSNHHWAPIGPVWAAAHLIIGVGNLLRGVPGLSVGPHN